MPNDRVINLLFNIVNDKANHRRALHELSTFQLGNGCFVSILIVTLIAQYTKFKVYLAEFF